MHRYDIYSVLHVIKHSELKFCNQSSADTVCVDGTVHLVGGHSLRAGRVEYCYNGTWHSVCSNGWDDVQEARVVCNTLGYDTSLGEGNMLM